MSTAKNKKQQDSGLIEDSFDEEEGYTKEELKDRYQMEQNPNDLMYNSNEDLSTTDNINNEDSDMRVLHPSVFLRELELLWRGFIKKGETYYQTGNPLATSTTINLLIGGLKSIINETTMAAYKTQDQIDIILLEKCKEIIVTICDDPTVLMREANIEALGNQCEHALELFLSFTLQGHGSQLIAKLRARVYDPNNGRDKQANKSFFDDMKQRFGGNN